VTHFGSPEDRVSGDSTSAWSVSRRRWHWPPSLPGSKLAEGWSGIAFVSLVATVLSWQPDTWRPVSAALDPAWQAALAMGFTLHIQWGPSLIFTYGPYGSADYLVNFYDLTSFIALTFGLIVTWGLAALIVIALRKSWGLVGGGVAAWGAVAIASNMIWYSGVAPDTALALALTSLWTDQVQHRLVLLSLLGALAGFDLLVKFNDGLVGLGLIIVSVAFVKCHRARSALAAGVPLVAVALLAWIGADQSVTNLASYVRGSLSVAAGYGQAMGHAGSASGAALAVLMEILLAGIVAVSLRGRARRQQIATLVILAGWDWALLKEGFVRADIDHNGAFFGLLLVAFCLVRLKRSLLPLHIGAVALAALVACHEAGAVPRQLHNPVASASALANELATTMLPGRFAEAQVSARREFLSTGGALGTATLALLEGHSVAVEPTEDSVVYTYPQLRWDPEPVVQAYSAYTTHLDDLDAAFLASSRAPQRILYQAGWTIDDRDPYFDPPATLESMYCHYVQLAARGPSQVLARVPDRCARAVPIGRAIVHFDQAITVPQAPGQMVLATFSFTTPLKDKVGSLLMRSPAVEVRIWTTGRQPATYRFVPGTAADEHVLSTPTALGYSFPFTPTSVRRIELAGDGWQGETGKVRVTFYARKLLGPRGNGPPAQGHRGAPAGGGR
jgi:hypothetical protein